MEMLGPRLIGGLFAAIFLVTALRLIFKPPARLAARVRPYIAASRSALNKNSDLSQSGGRNSSEPESVIEKLYRPIVESIVGTLTKFFGGVFDDESLSLKLRQSGLLFEIPEGQRVYEFRFRQVANGLGFAVLAGFISALLSFSPPVVLLMAIVGAVFGVAKISAGVSSRIDQRRQKMRIELYTVNQLLAIYLRTSGSPILAAQRLTKRGRGEVIDDLNEALRLHARGMSATKAFNRIADITPEPFASRTYKLLANGSERGADLAQVLLALSEDVRDARRNDVKRNATKRQGAMLIPIIVFLAPVMLLFIAAPLPSLITGG